MNTPFPAADTGRARILTVDDHAPNNEILCRMLARDFDTVSATSGVQALAMLADGPLPDIILLDVMMPEMDGYAVCKILKADPRTRDIPVIFVTALTDHDSEVRAIESGAVDFLHKPVNLNVVRIRVGLQVELARHRHHLEELVRERTGQLEDALRRVESASRVKSQFLANMSHEFRTPMNGIIGLTHLVAAETSDALQRERLQQISGSAHGLLGVLNDILDWTQLESSQLVLEPAPFALDALLTATRHHLQLHPQVQGKGLQVTLDMAPELQGLCVVGDQDRLGRLLQHFADNAARFTERGSIGLSAEVQSRQSGAWTLRLSVRDTGVGVAEELRQRIFDAFEQGDGTSTRRHGGTGLGLAICRRLARLMGGEVGVDSVLGQGSTFWLRVALPVKSCSEAAPAGVSQASVPQHGMPALPTVCRVLVVDDNAVNRTVVAKVLETKGWQVDLAVDGAEAVRRVQQTAYDIILMDVQMPVMDGLEATRAIRMLPNGANTPVVALTANAFEDDRRNCLVAGMNDLLAKPVHPPQLFATVARWLCAH